MLDPSRTNVAEALCTPCESEGTTVRHTAAEAHWQAGKTERRVCPIGCCTQTEADRRECVTQALVAKNFMLNITGVNPFQFVFGRNLAFPVDLLLDDPSIVASEASSGCATLPRHLASTEHDQNGSPPSHGSQSGYH